MRDTRIAEACALPSLAELANPCGNFLGKTINETGDVLDRIELVVLYEGRQVNTKDY